MKTVKAKYLFNRMRLYLIATFSCTKYFKWHQGFMGARFTSTYAINAVEFDTCLGQGTLKKNCDNIVQWSAAGLWFSMGALVFLSTNKMDYLKLIELSLTMM